MSRAKTWAWLAAGGVLLGGGGMPALGGTPVAPDLVVTQAVQDPPNPTVGQSWRFLVTIKNQGNGTANIPNGAAILSENSTGRFNSINTSVAVSLAAGQTYQVIKYVGLQTAGPHPVTFQVDPGNAVAESNEANNSLETTYSLVAPVGKPDLVITQVSTSVANPTVNGFDLKVTVKNQGTALATNQIANRLVVRTVGNDSILCKGSINLTPGSSVTFICPATRLQAGPQTWSLKVDPDDFVAETNKDNNTLAYPITIGSGEATATSDLVITAVSLSTSEPRKFTVTIRNAGTGVAVFSPGIQLIAEDSSGSFNGITRSTALTLAAGQSTTVIKYSGGSAGTRAITFKVDPENRIPEANEGNNTSTETFTLQ